MKALLNILFLMFLMVCGCTEKIPTNFKGDVIFFTAENDNSWKAELLLSQDKYDGKGQVGGGSFEFFGKAKIFCPGREVRVQALQDRHGCPTGVYVVTLKKNGVQTESLKVQFTNQYEKLRFHGALNERGDVLFPFFPKGPITWVEEGEK